MAMTIQQTVPSPSHHRTWHYNDSSIQIGLPYEWKDGSREDQEPWNDGDSGGTKMGDQREWELNGGHGVVTTKEKTVDTFTYALFLKTIYTLQKPKQPVLVRSL
jgi:hypothetical protein